MKINGNYKQWSVSQTQLGKILEVSQARINQLIDEEIVLRDESSKGGAVLLIDSLKNYYLSKNAATDDNGNSVNFWKEKGLHERAKRKMAELKLRERKGELYEAETVENVLFEITTNFRNKLLGLPSKFSAQLEGKPKEKINVILTEEIERCLEELSRNYTSADFKAESNEEFFGTDDDDFEGDTAT